MGRVSLDSDFVKAIAFDPEGTPICLNQDHFASAQSGTNRIANLCLRERAPLNSNLHINTAQAPRTFRAPAFWFVIVTLLGMWPALTNGQPFFYPDTTAYVRGADLAISKALGSRFATDWARDQRRAVQTQTVGAGPGLSSPEQKPARRVVLAGRSIIYGALLYLGALTGGMWFSIIVQSLVAVYLIFLFVVRTLCLNFRYFLVSCGVLLLASPLPFYVSFLMPDVFAGFLILSFAILAVGWERLSRIDRAITSGVLLFAALSHTSHILLLIGLTALTATYVAFTGRFRWTRISGLIGIAAACVFMSLLWEVAFSFAVSRALGTPPVRPPFITAKLVEILGQSAVTQVCISKHFAVCQFRDRLPLDYETFLWSEDERTGVFQVADSHTKQVLGDEQMRFAVVIIPPNLGRFVSGVFHDAVRQLTVFGLGEYSYGAQGLEFFKKRLPAQDFERMTSSLAARSSTYAVWGSAVSYSAAVISVLLVIILLNGSLRPTGAVSEAATQHEHAWRTVTHLLCAGILLNAIICGSLSSVNNRYEARVIWLIQLSSITGLCVMRPHLKPMSIFNPIPEKNAAAVQASQAKRR